MGILALHSRLCRDALGILCSTFHVLDATCDSQAWGYPNIQAYYDDINGLKWIPKIRTPTLFLSAEDDPFLG